MQLPHLSHSRRWQRLGILRPFLIIVATLLFVLAASYRLSSQQAVMLAGAVVALWGVLLLWRWPQWGLVAYVLLTMSLGVTDSMGLGSYVNEATLLVTGLAGLWLLDMVVREKSIRLVRTGPLLPLLALVVVSLLAFANGQLLWFFFARPAPLPAQLAGLAMFLLSAAAFLLAAHRFTELRWLRYVTWVFLGFGTLFIISRVAPGLGAQRFLAPGLHGGLFWVWVVALSLTQALFNHDLKPGWRAGLGTLALAMLALGFSQHRDWASAWLPPLIAAGVAVWLRSWRLGLALTVLVVGGRIALEPELIADLIAADEYSINTRWAAWEIVLGQIARVSPVLGLGPSNYYYYTPLFSILGWNVQFNSHNQYVDLVAQIGFLGLLCYLWFALALGRLGWRLRTQVTDGFATAYVYGVLAGLAGTLATGMLADWVIPFVYNIGLKGFRSSAMAWIFMGGLVAIERLSSSSKRAPA
jgi:hypothetical protein